MLRRLWIRYRIVLYGMFLFGLWAGGYYATGALASGRASASVMTPVDPAIPFEPVFIFIYITVYPVFLVPFLLIKDRNFFRVVGSAYLTVMIVCYAVYLFFPVSSMGFRVSEETLQSVDNFAYYVMGLVYHGDTTYNCFPSMHASLSLIAALTMLEIDRRWGALALLATLNIGASTLLTKQHFIADIFVGYALAMIVYYVYFKQRIIETLPHRVREMEGRIGAAIDERIARVVDRTLDERIEVIVQRKLEELNSEKDTTENESNH